MMPAEGPTVCPRCRLAGAKRMLAFLRDKRQEQAAAGQLAEAEALEAAIAGVLRLRLPCRCDAGSHAVGELLPEEEAMT